MHRPLLAPAPPGPRPAGWTARRPRAVAASAGSACDRQAGARGRLGRSRRSCAAAARPHCAACACLRRQRGDAENEFAGAGGQHHARRVHAMKSGQLPAQGGIAGVGVLAGIGLPHGCQRRRARRRRRCCWWKNHARHARGVGAAVDARVLRLDACTSSHHHNRYKNNSYQRTWNKRQNHF